MEGLRTVRAPCGESLKASRYGALIPASFASALQRSMSRSTRAVTSAVAVGVVMETAGGAVVDEAVARVLALRGARADEEERLGEHASLTILSYQRRKLPARDARLLDDASALRSSSTSRPVPRLRGLAHA